MEEITILVDAAIEEIKCVLRYWEFLKKKSEEDIRESIKETIRNLKVPNSTC